jgi:hypothetical protein
LPDDTFKEYIAFSFLAGDTCSGACGIIVGLRGFQCDKGDIRPPEGLL